MTPERRAILYLEDIVEHSKLAISFATGRSEEDLSNDLQFQYAVVRALEIIGEAARAVPESFHLLAPEVPWCQIVSMRNKIVHHYFGVKVHVIWSVIENDLEPLIASVERLLVEVNLD